MASAAALRLIKAYAAEDAGKRLRNKVKSVFAPSLDPCFA
jgi:hypothetical protein